MTKILRAAAALAIAAGLTLGFTISAPPARGAEPTAADSDAATIALLAANGIEVKKQPTEPVRTPYLPASQQTKRIGEVSCLPNHGAFYEGVLYSQPNATGNTQGIQFCNYGACDAGGYVKNLVEMGGPWWGGGIRSFWWNAYNNCPSFEFVWKGPGQTQWITSNFRGGPYVVNVWAGYPTQVRLVRYYCC